MDFRFINAGRGGAVVDDAEAIVPLIAAVGKLDVFGAVPVDEIGAVLCVGGDGVDISVNINEAFD